MSSLIQAAGGIQRLEPTHFNYQHTNPDYRRTDIETILGNKHILVDVSVVNPTCASSIKVYKSDLIQLETAHEAAKDKIKKHRENAASQLAQFVPFIMETLGGIIAPCKEFLRTLTRFAGNYASPSAFVYLSSLLYPSIAVAVQKGNFKIFRKSLAVPPRAA